MATECLHYKTVGYKTTVECNRGIFIVSKLTLQSVIILCVLDTYASVNGFYLLYASC